MFSKRTIYLLLCVLLSAAAFAGNNAQFISQSIPQRVSPGSTASVSVTMKNTGTTTWDYAWYKLSAQNPYDNTVWFPDTRAYMANGTYVAPGQQVTFNFTITAPSTRGIYNFQWRMIQEYTEVFGDFTPPSVITVSPVSCSSYADPNDTVGDDAGVQCLLDQGGTTLLAPTAPSAGDTGYLVEGRLINSVMTGLTIKASNTTIDSAPGTNAKARIKAAAGLSGTIPLRSNGYDSITLQNLIFDGNRDARSIASLCPSGFRPNVTTVELWGSTGFDINNSEFVRAVCGAALGIGAENGSGGDYYSIDNNYFDDNGIGATDYRPPNTEPWADGIRVIDCTNASITNNTFDDSTDLSLSIENTTNCTIENNLIRQYNRYGIGGIGFANHTHSGTVMRYNTVQGNNLMSIGFAIGGNPWCASGASSGATIQYNTISGAKVGMNVQESSHTINNNTITHPSGSNSCGRPNVDCNVNSSSNMQTCTTTTTYDYACCIP
ncbi:MAG TPA: right-handed parallel beta-helix repeat-containing protein [Thermoanaerobaculia bacterium]|nr:right-handed parallel beta-helix repeat-containing protein [Thermoanaerobaculia bacterium]